MDSCMIPCLIALIDGSYLCIVEVLKDNMVLPTGL
jgi:hypothetical protein